MLIPGSVVPLAMFLFNSVLKVKWLICAKVEIKINPMSFFYLTLLIRPNIITATENGAKFKREKWIISARQSNHPYQRMLSHCFELTCKFYQFLNNFHCPPTSQTASSLHRHHPNLIPKIQIYNLIHFVILLFSPTEKFVTRVQKYRD